MAAGGMGWPSSPLREQYDATAGTGDGGALRQQSATNDAEIRTRQSRQRTVPGQSVGNDLAGRLSAGEVETKARIEKGRIQVSRDAGTLSESYKGSVRIGKVSTNHGGNQAVWDTVGANASQPDLGTPPKVEPIGQWHFDKRGVPVAGPEPETAAPGTKQDPPSGKRGDGAAPRDTGKTRGQ